MNQRDVHLFCKFRMTFTLNQRDVHVFCKFRMTFT